MVLIMVKIAVHVLLLCSWSARKAVILHLIILYKEMTPAHPDLYARALALLTRFYGYRSFRPGQWEVIEAVACGRDALVIMPTGGGKSICYQLPALLAEGRCAVVVSPLIALMQDQTQGLQANGIPAAAVNSNQSESLNERAFLAAMQGRLSLLYVSPERLMAELDRFRALPISLFAIDEAHCISQWGHDFRPDYTALKAIKTNFPAIPVVALTATADRLTRDDIATRLRLVDPHILISSFDRPNISLTVHNNPGKKERMQMIRDLARKYPQDSGVVYCLSRKNVDDTATALAALGLSVTAYHAGMSADSRKQALDAFLSGTAQIVVATVAFGMGIDKSNIRWVVHCNMPGNIESYYQEVGRAGRDGLPAEAVMFYSLSDFMTRRSFAEESGQKDVNLQKLNRMKEYAEAQVCRRRILLNYFGEERGCDCGNCDNCLHPKQRFDGTITAQKALSGIMRTGQRVTMGTLNALLRGVHRYDVTSEGYDRLPTFGCGASMTADMWDFYIAQMLQLGVVDIAYDDANRLRATPLGMRILRGEERLEMALCPPKLSAKERRAQAKAAVEAPKSLEEQLVAQLKALRTRLAQQEKIPPYLVFSDATLADMAARQPENIEQFLQVSGVGEKKAAKYGRRFIDAIRSFKGLERQGPGTTLRETLAYFNSGLTPDEIADIRKIKKETVMSHLAQLIAQGLVTAYHRVISGDDFKAISSAIKSGTENEELYARFPGELIGVTRAIIKAVE